MHQGTSHSYFHKQPANKLAKPGRTIRTIKSTNLTDSRCMITNTTQHNYTTSMATDWNWASQDVNTCSYKSTENCLHTVLILNHAFTLYCTALYTNTVLCCTNALSTRQLTSSSNWRHLSDMRCMQPKPWEQPTSNQMARACVTNEPSKPALLCHCPGSG